MANEKEDIGKDGSKKREKPNTWIENIREEIHDLDVEFPLSGNEDGHPHIVPHHPHTGGVYADGSDDDLNTEDPKISISWLGNIIDKIQDLDTDFPLSGGEEDPRPAHHKKPEEPVK